MSDIAKKPVTFLLVDDHEENLIALEALVEREGLQLLKARSGTDALELLLTHDVSLALLDVNMPDMDGFELAELMRGASHSRHVPIIFLTANVTEQHRIFQGYDAGAVDFLVKPIEPRILRNKVATFFELARQKQQIAETLHLSEMFAAQVGHDLKNPLNAIVITSRLIEDRATDPTMKRHAQRLCSTSMRMAKMIDDLFDLSRARLGEGIRAELEKGDAVVVAKKAIADHEAAHPARTIRLESSGDTTGEWDLARLEQVVSNLVGNALHHGSADGAVDVSLRSDAAELVLAVHNEGAIPQSFLPRIFEPFRSGGAPNGRHRGLGLGLFIVRQIVSAHAGRIEVRSNDREGTTFVVRLPRRSPRA